MLDLRKATEPTLPNTVSSRSAQRIAARSLMQRTGMPATTSSSMATNGIAANLGNWLAIWSLLFPTSVPPIDGSFPFRDDHPYVALCRTASEAIDVADGSDERLNISSSTQAYRIGILSILSSGADHSSRLVAAFFPVLTVPMNNGTTLRQTNVGSYR